jgi:thioredoxin 1
MVGPIIDKLSEEYKGKVKICKLNVDENHDMAGKYQVMSIPTVLFFKGGQLVGQSLGAAPERVLRSKVQELL